MINERTTVKNWLLFFEVVTDTLSEEDYKELTMIMQLLHDNLTLWTSTAKVVGAESGAGLRHAMMDGCLEEGFQ